MAIGRITSPTTPIPIGTVATPTWATTVEDDINGLLDGVGPTFKALKIDGTGGAAASTASGGLELTTAKVQTSVPAPTVARGVGFKEAMVLAWGRFTGIITPTVLSAYNIASISRTSAGVYVVTVNSAATGSNYLCPIITVNSSGAAIATFTITSSTVIGVNTFNTAGTATDFDFGIIVFAG